MKASGVRLVVVESPFACKLKTCASLAEPCPHVRAHEAYARASMLDCLRRGEAPFASHLLYTQVLNDLLPIQRTIGIAAGLAWAERADATVVYEDFGISGGMRQGIEHAIRLGRAVEHRRIPGWGERT